MVIKSPRTKGDKLYRAPTKRIEDNMLFYPALVLLRAPIDMLIDIHSNRVPLTCRSAHVVSLTK